MKGRGVPKGHSLGGPSHHLTLYEWRAFERFRAELPWLKESHRALVELAAMLRGQLLDPEFPGLNLKTMQELRRCLGQLGATPADESRIPHGDEEEDPDEAFFASGGGRPN
jgi:hypothetical protein